MNLENRLAGKVVLITGGGSGLGKGAGFITGTSIPVHGGYLAT